MTDSSLLKIELIGAGRKTKGNQTQLFPNAKLTVSGKGKERRCKLYFLVNYGSIWLNTPFVTNKKQKQLTLSRASLPVI